MSFSVTYHHTGNFVKDPDFRYDGIEEHVFHGVDGDTWSYFAALKLVRSPLGHLDDVKLWWKPKTWTMMIEML